MSCLTPTPIVSNILSDTNSANNDGWVSVPSISTSALSQYYSIQSTPSVITFSGVFETTYQHGKILQLQFEETATSSANIRKTALQVYLYSGASPTVPTAGAVYNGATTSLMGIVEIATGDYKRLSDTVWIATVTPTLYVRTTSSNIATNVYAVVLANETKTYAASASARLRIITEADTALS